MTSLYHQHMVNHTNYTNDSHYVDRILELNKVQVWDYQYY